VQELPEPKGVSLTYFDTTGMSAGQLSAELTALHYQHRFFQRELGVLVPKSIPIEQIHTVLDLICYSGGWCIDLSKAYPDKEIVGIDMDEQIIQVARENAAPLRTDKLLFRAEKKLPFESCSEATFDLVHFQNSSHILTLTEKPAIMAEIYRLLKPGGWLNLIDFEMGPVSSPSLDRVLTIVAQIMAKQGLNLLPDASLPFNTCTFGPKHLIDAGFTEVSYYLHPVNLGGWNNPMGRSYLTSCIVRPNLIKRLAVQLELETEEKLQPLLNEMLREIRQIGFCGAGMLLSVVGKKPLTTTSAQRSQVTATKKRLSTSGKTV
jgi:SAM-dependent methyltransferase